MTLDDLEPLEVQIFSEFCANLHFWETTTAKRMKIYPCYQRQKCSPMTPVSGNITRIRIFAGVPLSGGVKWQWGCRRRQFLVISVATSSETLSACNWLQNEWPRMTLSGCFMSKSVLGQQGYRALTFVKRHWILLLCIVFKILQLVCELRARVTSNNHEQIFFRSVTTAKMTANDQFPIRQ